MGAFYVEPSLECLTIQGVASTRRLLILSVIARGGGISRKIRMLNLQLKHVLY